MVEAVGLRGEFRPDKGWTRNKVSDLINALVSYITTVDKTKYCQFACTIDMSAYKKLQGESYQLESPVDLCNRTCVTLMVDWYISEYKGSLDFEASYFFDQNEPFEPLFKAQWERETEIDRITGKYNTVWSHIKHVGTADMRVTTGLQVADMLAWSRNREENNGPTYNSLFLALSRLAPSKWIVWNEETLRKKFRPLIWTPR